jgi:hypothetical protein
MHSVQLEPERKDLVVLARMKGLDVGLGELRTDQFAHKGLREWDYSKLGLEVVDWQVFQRWHKIGVGVR